jgi:hypothetical protein
MSKLSSNVVDDIENLLNFAIRENLQVQGIGKGRWIQARFEMAGAIATAYYELQGLDRKDPEIKALIKRRKADIEVDCYRKWERAQ